MTSPWSAGQVALRLTIAIAPVFAVSASGLDAGAPPIWLLLLVGVVSSGHAFLPESGLGTAAMLLVLGWWGLGPVADAGLPWSSVVAAVGLLAAHIAAVIVGYGPGDLPVDRALLWTWLGRAAVVSIAAPAVWLIAVGVEDQPEPTGIWVAGLVAATVAVVVASAALLIEEEPQT